MTSSLLRRKPLQLEPGEERRLARTLGWPHLMALGVGAIVGTGILTLIGVGAAKAGPAVILSFAIAGAICACAALAYAEMATMIPVSGSAYTYSYVVLGEILAWIIGWSLILEYSLVVSAVAVGWSGYAAPLLENLFGFPRALMQGPDAGGIVNLPAVAIIVVVAVLLLRGTRESATVNAALVLVKIAALIVFVVFALPAFDAAHLEPFNPFGFVKSLGADGVERGIMAAAAIIFFAFYGFDAIATAAEETRDPGRDLIIGIVGSMAACVVIYVAVAVTAVGAVSYTRFADSPEPLALILRELGRPLVAQYLAASAVIALPTVILAFFYGQSRIFFTMARDGMLPQSLAKLSSAGTPVRITLFTAAVVTVLAGLVPLGELAALANAGTLAAFIAVAACMLVMRVRAPDAPRTFRAPAPWLIGAITILGCGYLFFSLPAKTQLWFAVWNVLGLVFYGLYGRKNASVAAG
ncbi:UNVERIFIED_ORG: APA family basic amino acid/polyamine antiporter [Methylobacterium sp. SuP10 SLI 274]|uniref:amino acid permease n=1 Tax=Methylorubrum extorquens TaxID=408 RepID=UPI00209F34EE|nr:amino acid permease [Methylorubrum extorquens]MCP1560009.1 APA family basic amino acid/polyamine antiporter [Methylorubrum extorquens]MDF9865363.1 APA family basic amino acid/polyamine antiporter [Methylorubrum pseudosasae]MDH6638932.1 APA family basic amino acid/polyamine antiporter [Methylobacterium sp. SuP10 SLI 274]MDH6668120.1 APA family basic amino acid/polyamine antiporter [Methylorubrum zatmanii]